MSGKRNTFLRPFEIIKNHVFDNHWNSPKCHHKLLEIAFQGPRFKTCLDGTGAMLLVFASPLQKCGLGYATGLN
jgi:hypothetical protein